MGFVSSASSVYLDVQLTNYGRGVVLSGDLKTRISKFSLSDSDIDYRLPINTGHTTAVSQGGSYTRCFRKSRRLFRRCK